MLRTVLTLLICTQLNTVANAQNPDQYFGIPLGVVHLSQDSTSGEFYLYDEYSILINHFEHHPKRSHCTSMMVGPPRFQDAGDSLVEGHGVLVGLAHPLVQAPNSDAPISKRHKRQAGRLFGGNIYRWPVEMDHLLMGPDQGKNVPSAAVPLPSNPFTGIHIRNLNSAPEGKNITIAANMTVAQETTTQYAVEPASRFVDTTTQPSTTIESTTTEIPTTESTTTSTQPPSTSKSTTTVPSTTSSTSSIPRAARKGLVVTASVRSKAVSPRLQKLSLHAESTKKPVIVQASEKEESTGIVEMIDANDVFASDTYNSQENNEFERQGKGAYKLDVHYSDLDFIRKLNNNEDTADFPRRAPSRNSGIQVFNSADKFTGAQTQRPSNAKSTTPLFYVVDDPHRGHRERILQQLVEFEKTTTTTTPAPVKPLDSRFALPESREQLGIFLLSNGGKLSDYHWFGLYNHCDQKHVELVSLRGVDPPQEERIMPVSGWSHNISSYRVQILNCNTLLVPGFNFDPEETARGSTYFVAGIGQFPDNIEKQVKAIVVGERQNAPLRQYKNEDVLLRLPRTYRTFDIDFLSIFNTHEQKSYGHVVIPSLLVPPCTDD